MFVFVISALKCSVLLALAGRITAIAFLFRFIYLFIFLFWKRAPVYEKREEPSAIFQSIFRGLTESTEGLPLALEASGLSTAPSILLLVPGWWNNC